MIRNSPVPRSARVAVVALTLTIGGGGCAQYGGKDPNAPGAEQDRPSAMSKDPNPPGAEQERPRSPSATPGTPVSPGGGTP